MHSPEPWKHETRRHDGTYDNYEAIIDAAGEEVVVVGNENYEDGSYPNMLPEDARRIVACVNACRGYDTTALELWGTKLPKQPDQRFLELCRQAYRAMYSQQKHLDSGNTGQMGHGQYAMKVLVRAFGLLGLDHHKHPANRES